MKLPKVSLPRVKITPLAVKSITTAYFGTQKNLPKHQGKFLLERIEKTKDTAYGKRYHFSRIKSIEDFQKLVPLNEYKTLQPRIDRALRDETDVLVPGIIPWFATSSGTTGGGAKFIPVTKELLKYNHYKGGTDAFMYYAYNNPETKIFMGQGIVIGGGFSRNPYTHKKNVGYITAILQKNAPLLAKLIKQPKSKIAYLLDREKKVEKMIETTHTKNITSISGSPAWCSLYLQKMCDRLHAKNVLRIRPSFEVVFRGGMSIDLYRDVFIKLLPSKDIQYYQVYNASEGCFAVQHKNDADDMILLLNHKIFYEFIPFKKFLQNDFSEVLTINNISTDEEYVIVITNNSGLYRYILGDVITFTGTQPHTIKVTGRTSYYIDVASECTPLQPIENSLLEMAKQCGGVIKEYHICPGHIQPGNKGFYEIYIERSTQPKDKKICAKVFDDLLCNNFSYYHDERRERDMIGQPVIHHISSGTFHKWLKNKGKLGGQHKVPKIMNDRKIAEELNDII